VTSANVRTVEECGWPYRGLASAALSFLSFSATVGAHAHQPTT
jgi:hypothetical protein